MTAQALDPFPARPTPIAALDLQRLGEGRVRIQTADAGEIAAQSLLAWLKDRREVEEVAYDRRTGAIEVRYAEPKRTAGSFVVNLRDRLFAMGRPPVARGFQVVLAHGIPGRARLRLEGATIDELLRLTAWLADRPGVQRASPAPAAASILVLYDAALTTDDALLADIARADPREWPAASPLPSARSGWAKTALNTAVLAATATGALPSPSPPWPWP